MILKIIGIVLLALILIIFVLLLFSIRAYIEFDSGRGGLRLRVKYLFLTVFKLDTAEKSGSEPKKAEKPRQDGSDIEITELTEVSESDNPTDTAASDPENPKKPHEDKDNDDDEESGEGEDKKGSGSIMAKWNAVKPFIPKAKKALGKLFKLIRIKDLDIALTVGGEDAHKAAINFARVNGVFYNALALICCLFKVKIKSTKIDCDYEKSAFGAKGSLTVSARVISLAMLIICVLSIYLKAKPALDKASEGKQ